MGLEELFSFNFPNLRAKRTSDVDAPKLKSLDTLVTLQTLL